MKGELIFDQPMLAFDNSPLSHLALDVLDTLRSHVSKVNIISVHNPKKTYIPNAFKGPNIYQQLTERYPEKQNPNLKIDLKELGEKNTNMIILENFITKSSSILFLGFVGSKGFKPRNKDLSSRVRQFVYQSKLNLAIIKTANKNMSEVLFCFDGSDISLEGLSNAVQFCKKFKKQLTVLHVYNQDLLKHSKHVKNILKTVQESMKDFKFKVTVEESELIPAICSKSSQFEWVVFNRNGYRGSITKQRFVGSKAQQILVHVPNNLIIFN